MCSFLLQRNTLIFVIVIILMCGSAVTTLQVYAQQDSIITFDPPEFSEGQIITSLPGVVFGQPMQVFTPKNVATISPPYALRTLDHCSTGGGAQDIPLKVGSISAPNFNGIPLFPDALCANQASRLVMAFDRQMRSVSLQAGIDESTVYESCFPEGSYCSTYGRLIGYNETGTLVADSGDILIVNVLENANVRRDISVPFIVNSPAENIRYAIFFVGENSLAFEAENYPVRVQIDSFGFSAAGATPIPTPPIPTIELTRPTANQSYTFPYEIRVTGQVTALGGLVAFCAYINTPDTSAGNCPQKAQLGRNATFDFILSDTSALNPTNNIVYVFAFDSFGQKSSVQVPIQLQTPPTPSIQIFSPDPGQYWELADLYFWGDVVAPGGVAAFCIAVNNATVPPQPNCNQLSELSLSNSFGTLISNTSLVLGPNTLYAFAYDRWGQLATGSVIVTMPTDIRITAVEITQGVQSEAIQLNDAPVVRYSGATLVSGGRTVVRVFANSVAGGPYNHIIGSLCAELDQLVQPRHYVDCIFPDNGEQTLSAGSAAPTLNERANTNGAFVFTLPPSWTNDTDRAITLRASLIRRKFLLECNNCQANNDIVVSDIRFVQRNSVAVAPIEIIWTNGAGVTMRPSRTSDVFFLTDSITPLAENGLIIPPNYVATIDVTGILTDPNTGVCDEDCGYQIVQRVADYAFRLYPTNTIGISRGLKVSSVAFPLIQPSRGGLVWVAAALANEEGRALSTIAHELYHLLGFPHAGRACPNVEGAEEWPPDDRGLLQGVGLDRRILPNLTLGADGIDGTSDDLDGPYRIIAAGAPGQPSEYVDLMSYCAVTSSWVPGESLNTWLSLRNSNTFASRSPGITLVTIGFWFSRDQVEALQTISTPNNGEETLRVQAVLPSQNTVTLLSVATGESEFLTSVISETPYELVTRDLDGNELARYYVPVVPSHENEEGTTFGLLSAEIPGSDVAIIEVTLNDTVIATTQRSPNTPQVELLSHTIDQETDASTPITIEWEMSDGDGDALEARIEYSVDGGETYRLITNGVQENYIELPSTLFPGSDSARLRITVNDGFNEGVAISAVFRVAGRVPQVAIVEPSPAQVIRSDNGLRLVGRSFDDRGLPIAESQLQWFVNDALVGEGAILYIRPPYQEDQLRIEFRATDDDGLSSSESVSVQVRRIVNVSTEDAPAPENWIIIVIAIVIVAAGTVFWLLRLIRRA